MNLFSIVDKVWKNEPVSDQELGTLLRWLLSDEGKHEYTDAVQKEWETFHTDRTRDYSAFLQKINNTLDAKEKARRKPLRHRLGRVAAIVIPLIAAVGIGAYYFTGGFDTAENHIAQFTGDPTLIMPDGSRIVLDRSTENSPVAVYDDIALVRENGKLVHRRQSDGVVPTGEIEWGAVEVPKGALFDMVLEDGTMVWLNAGSRLRFPLEFSGGERRVHLEGEAYFVVAKNEQMPFILETPRQNVRVLGTEFNVYAYHDGGHEHTTLVRGSVSVQAGEGGGPIILRPGQQAALLSASEGFSIKDVDAGEYTLWRDGIFVFEDDTLGDVFTKLARWYDIEYSFDNESLSRLTLSGTLPHSEDMNDILKVIASVTEVDIAVKGNRVTISGK